MAACAVALKATAEKFPDPEECKAELDKTTELAFKSPFSSITAGTAFGSASWHRVTIDGKEGFFSDSNNGGGNLRNMPSMEVYAHGAQATFWKLGRTTEFDATVRIASADNDGFGFAWSFTNTESMYAVATNNQNKGTSLFRVAQGWQWRKLDENTEVFRQIHRGGFSKSRRTLFGTIHWQYIRVRTRIEPDGLRITVDVDFRAITADKDREWTRLFNVVDPDPIGPGLPTIFTYYDDKSFFVIDSYVSREPRCDTVVHPGVAASPGLAVLLDSQALRRYQDDAQVTWWPDTAGIGFMGPENTVETDDHAIRATTEYDGSSHAVVRMSSWRPLNFRPSRHMTPFNAGQTLFIAFQVTRGRLLRLSGTIYSSTPLDNFRKATLWVEDFDSYPLYYGFWETNTLNTRDLVGTAAGAPNRLNCDFGDAGEFMSVVDWHYARSSGADPGRGAHEPTRGMFLAVRGGGCSSQGGPAWTSEVIDLSRVDNAEIEFEWAGTGARESSDKLILEVKKEADTSWTTAWTRAAASAEEQVWSAQTVDIKGPLGFSPGPVLFRFRFVVSSSTEGFMVDNIRVNGVASAIHVQYVKSTERVAVRIGAEGVRALRYEYPVKESEPGQQPPHVLSLSLSRRADGGTYPRISMNGRPHEEGWTKPLGQPDAVAGPILTQNKLTPEWKLGTELELDIFHFRAYSTDLSVNDTRRIEQAIIREYGAVMAPCSVGAMDGAEQAAEVAGACAAGSAHGSECAAECRAGRVSVGGTAARTCRNGFWTGEPLRCSEACPVVQEWPANSQFGCHIGRLVRDFDDGQGEGSVAEPEQPWMAAPGALRGARAWPSADRAWSIRQGVLHAGNATTCTREKDDSDRYLFFPNSDLAAAGGAVYAEVTAAGVDAPLGVVLRAKTSTVLANQQARDHFLFKLDFPAGMVTVSRHGWGQAEQLLCNRSMPAFLKSSSNKWVDLVARMSSADFTFTAAGRTVCSGLAIGGSAQGDFGLWTQGGASDARFQRLKVWEERDGISCRDGCAAGAGQACRVRCDAPRVPLGLSKLRAPLADGYEYEDTLTCSWNGTAAVLSSAAVSCGFPAPSVQDASLTVNEGSAAGSNVGLPLNATIGNNDGTLEARFRIASGNDMSAFAISDCSGQLRVDNASALDFESGRTAWRLIVQVATAGDFALSSAEAVVLISVLDLNEPPVMLPQSRSVDEGSPEGTNVGGAILATDPEGTGPVFSISLGNDDGAFAINATSGQMTVAQSGVLDFETGSRRTLTVSAVDGNDDSLRSSALVSVTINDVDEPPAIANLTVSVREDFDAAAAGSRVIGSVRASDPDTGDSANVSLVAGMIDAASFTLATDGTLSVSSDKPFDFETKATLLAMVMAKDLAGNEATAFIIVRVADVDEPPVVSWPSSATMAENPSAGDVVAEFQALERDAGQTVIATILSQSPAGAVSVLAPATAGGGQITLSVANAAAFDFETNQYVSLRLSVTDSTLTNAVSVTLNVSITDVDEAPAWVTTAASLSENDGAATATFEASDPESRAVTYSIPSPAPAGLPFAVSSTGVLSVASPGLDFESQSQWVFGMQAADPAGNRAVVNVTVRVTDANDTPTLAAGTTINHPATTPGDVGLALSSLLLEDQDLSNPGSQESHSWSLTSQTRAGGAPVSFFAIDAASGQLSVLGASSSSLQTGDTYTISATVEDQAGASATATLTVAIVDGNAPPTGLVMQPSSGLTVYENSEPGSVIGRPSATDPNSGQSVTFTVSTSDSIAGLPGLPFVVTADGVLTTAGIPGVPLFRAIDFETGPRVWNLTLTATDDHPTAPLSSKMVVSVAVVDIAEPPFFDSASRVNGQGAFTVAMAETAEPSEGRAVMLLSPPRLTGRAGAVAHPNGTVTIAADDDETPGAITYAWDSAGCSPLRVNHSTGVLSPSGGGADFETAPVVACQLVATDSSGKTDEAAITVRVEDANDPPSIDRGQVLSIGEPTVSERRFVVPGSLAASPRVAFSDQDMTARWSGPTLEARLPVFASSLLDLSNASLMASLTDGEADSLFASAALRLDSLTGELTVAAGAERFVDWETRREVLLSVKATDTGGLSSLGQVSVRIDDAPDAQAVAIFGAADAGSLDDWLAEQAAAAELQGGDSNGAGAAESSGAATGNGTSSPPEAEADTESGGATVVIPTDGSGVVVFRGYSFSPSASELRRHGETLADYSTIVALYGPSSEPSRYSATCTATQPMHEIRCATQPGLGSGHRWTIIQTRRQWPSTTLVNQSIEVGALLTTGYEPPVITSVDVQNADRKSLPTTGGTASFIVTGRNLGIVGSAVRIEYASAGWPEATFSSECIVTTDHTRASCQLSPGAGAGMIFVFVTDGTESSRFLTDIAYAPPSLARVGLGVLRTSGGETIEIEGSGLPVAETIDLVGLSVEYSASFAPTAGGAATNTAQGRVYVAAQCSAPSVSEREAGRRLACTTAAGVGAGLAWRVRVAGRTSPVDQALPVSSRYAAPRVTSVEGPGLLNAATRGGDVFFVIGTSFGPETGLRAAPAALNASANASLIDSTGDLPSPLVSYGTFGASAGGFSARFVGVDCRVQVPDTVIECRTASGSGKDHAWLVSIAGQASEVHTATLQSYHPPVVAIEEAGAPDVDVLRLQTTGAQRVRIRGLHFGPDVSVIDRVTYGAASAGVGTSPLEYTATGCTMPVPHEVLECTTAEGAGSGHRWEVVIDGQQSVNPATSYARPVVEALSGTGSADASAIGGQEIVLTGSGFGPSGKADYLEAVTFGVIGYEFTAGSCLVTRAHEEISCRTTPSRPGQTFRWVVKVRGQYSDPSAATTTTAPPRITQISPLPFADTTEGGSQLVVRGFNLGTTASRTVLRFNSKQATMPAEFAIEQEGSVPGSIGPIAGTAAGAASSYRFARIARNGSLAAVSPFSNAPATLLAWVSTLAELRPVSERSLGTGLAGSLEEAVFEIPAGFGALAHVFLAVDDMVLSNVALFSYDAPTIINVAPDRLAAAAGQLRVFVDGSSFCANGMATGCGVVLVDGVPSTTVSAWSHTQIQLSTRAPATSSDVITVQVVVSGQASNVVSFSQPVPSFDALSSDQGEWSGMDPRGGEAFYISGVQDVHTFPESSISIDVGGRACLDVRRILTGQVLFGGTAVQLSRIQCTTPPGVGTALPITVVIDPGSGAQPIQSRVDSAFTFSYAAPVVRRIVMKDDPTRVVFGPGKNDDIPTVGAVVILEGSGLGTPALDPGLSVVVDTVADVGIVGSDVPESQAYLEVRVGAGAGGGLTLLFDVAGSRPANEPKLSFRSPSVLFVSPQAPAAPTAGGFELTIEGSDFGPGLSPNVTVGGRACPLAAQWIPSPQHNRITCIAPEGSGASSPIIVRVAGQASEGGASLEFNAPTVLSITPSATSTSGLVAGGGSRAQGLLDGLDFGPAGALEFVLHPAGGPVTQLGGVVIASMSSASVAVSPGDEDALAATGGRILSWNHTAIIFRMPSGFGERIVPRVVAGGQASDDSATALRPGALLEYSPPVVTGVGRADRDAASCRPVQRCVTTPGGSRRCVDVPAECFDAAGGYAVEVTGESFGEGPAAGAATVVTIGGRPCTLLPSMGRSHTSVVVVAPPGMGEGLPVVVSVGGRASTASAAAVFTYDPPILASVMPNSPDARGGQELTIRGKNFGASSSPVEVVIDGDVCANAEWLNDGSVRCTAPSMTVGAKNVSVLAANRSQPALLQAFQELFVPECKPGAYGMSGEACVTCADLLPGTVCPGFERFEDAVTATAGWWRFNVTTSDERCPAHRSNEGLRTGGSSTDALWCPSMAPCEPSDACLGSNLCAPGYTGDRCASCEPGTFHRVNGLCEKCPDQPWLIVVVFVVVAIAAVSAGFVLNSRQANVALVSIGVDYFQVLAMLSRSRVRWPPAIRAILHALSAFNLNLDLAAPECIVPEFSYNAKWLLTASVPVAVAAVFGAAFVAQYVWKRCIKGSDKKHWTRHGDQYVSVLIVIGYVLYFQETRNALDVFNCQSTDPPDGKQYLSGMTDIVCFEAESHLWLVPLGIAALGLYGVAFPAWVYTFLRRHRLEIKYDQVLRARGLGLNDIEMPNVDPVDAWSDPPNMARFRSRYQRLYYMFRMGKAPYWICVLLARKALLGGCSLLFRGQPSYQLAVALLIMFAAYVVHVRNLPFMSPSDYGRELAEHVAAAKRPMPDVRKASPHQRIRVMMDRWTARMGKRGAAAAEARRAAGWRAAVESSGQHAQASRRFEAESVAAAFVNYNAVESMLLASAVLVSLSGLMFLSERFAGDRVDAYRAEYDGLAFVIAGVVVLSLVYFAAVLVVEVMLRTNPQSLTRALSLCPGTARQARKAKAGSLTSPTAAAGSLDAAKSAAVAGEGGDGAGGSKVTMQVSALVALRGDRRDESAIVQAAELPLELPTDPRMWAAVRQQFVDNEEALRATKADLSSRRAEVARQRVGDVGNADGGGGLGMSSNPMLAGRRSFGQLKVKRSRSFKRSSRVEKRPSIAKATAGGKPATSGIMELASASLAGAAASEGTSGAGSRRASSASSAGGGSAYRLDEADLLGSRSSSSRGVAVAECTAPAAE